MADENMELDERKVKILDAVIRNYLATGEPVGSRTISKYTDLNLSSGTWLYRAATYISRKNSFRQRLSVLCGSSDAGKRPGSQRNEGLRNRKNPEDG